MNSSEQVRRQTNRLDDKHADDLAVEDVNILGDSLYSIENNNYKYIFNLLNKQNRVRSYESSRASSGGLRFIEKSFLYNLFEKILSQIYTSVPHMKVSDIKQMVKLI